VKARESNMNNLLRIGIIVIGLCVLPAIAGADTFMFVPGVAGDATDTAHKGWIRVASVDWGAHNNTTIGTATGGAGAGKSTGRDFKLRIPTGLWSRELLSTLLRGGHYPQVLIDQTNPDGRPVYRVTIQTLFFTDYRSAPTNKTPAEDEIEGVYGGFKVDYYTVSADGRVGTSSVGWNFVTNTALP
jgi:type VI secretion system secreted protein Hcp